LPSLSGIASMIELSILISSSEPGETKCLTLTGPQKYGKTLYKPF
jgi:hypothetical protein